MSPRIDTETLSLRYRRAAIEVDGQRLLMTNFHGSQQERDLSEPANCAGFGRIHHFKLGDGKNWPRNPLPIEPAKRALSLEDDCQIRAQVFQTSVCNWRCWYCFVPFGLLNANPCQSAWLTPPELVDLYLAEYPRPPIIVLSGGQPDLTPEWIPWMMDELQSRALAESVYLWSDDNLSTDYFWKYLTASTQRQIQEFRNYGRVGCFKGIDKESFAFNTNADPDLFDQQFELFRRFCDLKLDLYAYVTFTTPQSDALDLSVSNFVDRLQQIHPLLPLRTVPLEIRRFTPVDDRLREDQIAALQNQYLVARMWQIELTRRFKPDLLGRSMCDIRLK